LARILAKDKAETLGCPSTVLGVTDDGRWEMGDGSSSFGTETFSAF